MAHRAVVEPEAADDLARASKAIREPARRALGEPGSSGEEKFALEGKIARLHDASAGTHEGGGLDSSCIAFYRRSSSRRMARPRATARRGLLMDRGRAAAQVDCANPQL